MSVVDWNRYTQKWPHLRGINFPRVSARPIVDMLIGLDYTDLHYSMRDICAAPGQPSARLTPLGWTCVGSPNRHNSYKLMQTNYGMTYFVKGQSKLDDLNVTLKQFWEIERLPEAKPLLAEAERLATNRAESSLQFTDNRYRVAVPWKHEAKLDDIPNNYKMAMNRLQNTEKTPNKFWRSKGL